MRRRQKGIPAVKEPKSQFGKYMKQWAQHIAGQEAFADQPYGARYAQARKRHAAEKLAKSRRFADWKARRADALAAALEDPLDLQDVPPYVPEGERVGQYVPPYVAPDDEPGEG
jgi:hypothetical protein